MQIVKTLLEQLGLNRREQLINLGKVKDCEGQEEHDDEDSETGANGRLKLLVPMESQGHWPPIHVQLVALVPPTIPSLVLATAP